MRFLRLFLLVVFFLRMPVVFAGDFNVGLILDKAGKDDQSFNASAFRGSQKAEKELGVKVKTVEARDAASAESLMRALAGKKSDLLIAVGFGQAGAVAATARSFADRKFVIIDSEVKKPNVTSVMFAEHEGAFLMGAMAAMASKSGNVGFIGGMDIPLIRRFAMGYEAGVHYVDPKAKTQIAYIGVTKSWLCCSIHKEPMLYFTGPDHRGSGSLTRRKKRNFWPSVVTAIKMPSNQAGFLPVC